MTIYILLTSHNRKLKTYECIYSIYNQINLNKAIFKIILLDDGSSDGTRDLIKNEFPDVNIIDGQGDAYWSGGMRILMKIAMNSSPDYILWLNDDVKLFNNSISRLLSAHFNKHVDHKNGIVVGSLMDPITKTWTYGATKFSNNWHPLRFDPLIPDKNKILLADNFNGNLVLIPKEVYDKVGNIPDYFVHGGADHDYALRTRKNNFEIWLAPDYHGFCERNSIKGTWLDDEISLKNRFINYLSIKENPLKVHYKFLKKHSGKWFFILFLAPFFKIFLSWIRNKVNN